MAMIFASKKNREKIKKGAEKGVKQVKKKKPSMFASPFKKK